MDKEIDDEDFTKFCYLYSVSICPLFILFYFISLMRIKTIFFYHLGFKWYKKN